MEGWVDGWMTLTVNKCKLRLMACYLQQWFHDNWKVLHKTLPKYLAHSTPGTHHIRNLKTDKQVTPATNTEH